MTFNIWGAPFHFAKHRTMRMGAIAGHVMQDPPHVLALQEAYLEENRAILTSTLGNIYPYQHYFSSGVLGSGLFILSQYAIVDAAFLRFRLGGRSEDVTHGDYYVGKGIGMVRLDTPDGLLDVYNLHPHAQYIELDDNEYAIFTDSNLYEAARFIHAHSPHAPAIICGDMNTRPNQNGYALLTSLAKLRDTHSELYPDEVAVTYSPQNPYVKAELPQRLDYIFARDGETQRIVLEQSAITMTDLLQDGEALTFSDHYAVELAFRIENGAPIRPDMGVEGAAALQTLHELLKATYTQTLIDQNKFTDRAFIGAAAGGDLLLFGNMLQKRLPLGGFIRWGIIMTAFVFSLSNFVHVRFNLAARKQTLNALIQEIEQQLRAKRLFNGDTWD